MKKASSYADKPVKPLKLIWDIPVRLCHWAMVILVIAQWVTTELLDDAMTWHARFGYTLIGIVVFRLLWGIIGTHYAKFSQFLARPSLVVDYVKRSINKTAPTYTGHNPLGGWMSVALLLMLLVQGVSGLFMTDEIFFTGPYYESVSVTIQEIMSTTHHYGFTVLKIAVGLHIAAIIYYSIFKKQPLVAAMFTGKKFTSTRGIMHNYWLRAIVAMVVIAILVYCVVDILPPEPEALW